MFYLFIALIILACVLLVFVVLIQNPKGGGLNSNFAGSNNLMGVKRTGDILETGTWVLVVAIMVISLLINATMPTDGGAGIGGSGLGDQITPTSIPTTTAPNSTAPLAPVTTPQSDTTK